MAERRIVTPETYENAYSCILDGRCPQRNDSKGCPKWWECDGRERDAQGKERVVIIAGCMDSQQIMGHYLEAAWDKANETYREAQGMREQVLNRIGVVFANNMGNLPPETMQAALHAAKSAERLRGPEDEENAPAAH